MSEKTHTTRRNFLQAASAALAAPAVRAQQGGANDVIGVGLIGIGNISRDHFRRLEAIPEMAKIVAVCDIYKPHLDYGVSRSGAKGYHDYHDLLADPNVDVVFVLTPDHWHAPMAIDAMRAGKDVNVEKPMALTIGEARRMVEAAKETGRVLAVDSEHMAHGVWEPAAHATREGVLGKLLWSQTSRSRNTFEPPWNYRIDKDISPENLDWERFLGPTEKVPFDPERYFRWRRYWTYSGGIATDLYYHHITPLIHVTGREFPYRATAAGGNYHYSKDVLEVPDVFLLTLDFPGKHSIMVGGSLANSAELPIVVRGHEANIHFHGGPQVRPSYLEIIPEDPFVDGFREKVKQAGLEGTWREMDREPRRIDLPGLSYRRQLDAIASALADPRIKESYSEAAEEDPALEADHDKRVAFFQDQLAARARRIARKPVLRIDSPPAEDFTVSFLKAVRTRGKAKLDGELGYRAQVAVSLAVESYRRNQVMFFDERTGGVSETPPA